MAEERSQEAPAKKSNYNYKEFIEKTPCARNSLLYGVVSSMVVASGTFMFTKHIRKSCDFAVASFVVISLGSWQMCRYMNQKQKKEIERTVDLITRYSNTKERDETNPKLN